MLFAVETISARRENVGKYREISSGYATIYGMKQEATPVGGGMRILVVGSGGREHALVWKLKQSPKVSKVWCAPGNAGIAKEAECLPFKAEDLDGICRLAKREKPDLTVVGPEAPLVLGLADRLRALGLVVFGPSARAAALEGSKALCRDILRKSGVPSPDYQVFHNQRLAEQYLEHAPVPIVVKADGLAAGKGVVVCRTRPFAVRIIRTFMEDRVHGAAGDSIVFEEFLEGQEISVLCLADGRTIAPLVPAQDHKRLKDYDRGPNTGGMGAYAPTPFGSAKTLEQVRREILVPTAHGLAADDRRFEGVLYAGLMLTSSGPKVLEYNVRFGDPETQAVLFLMKSDLAAHLLACAEGRLENETIEWRPGAAVTVVMAAKGYPNAPVKGSPIDGIERAEEDRDVKVFHAGTALDSSGRLVTAGGRVLGVTAWGADLSAARDRVYAAVRRIRFPGAQWRRDIGAKALDRDGRLGGSCPSRSPATASSLRSGPGASRPSSGQSSLRPAGRSRSRS